MSMIKHFPIAWRKGLLHPRKAVREAVKLSDLRGTEEIRVRSKLRPESVDEYGQHYNKLPPILCVRTPAGVIWRADGRHRCAAGARILAKTIQAYVVEGDLCDARVIAAMANAEHTAVKVSNADRRETVRMLISDPYLTELSSRELAEIAGCSHSLVNAIRGNPGYQPRKTGPKPKPAAREPGTAPPPAPPPSRSAPGDLPPRYKADATARDMRGEPYATKLVMTYGKPRGLRLTVGGRAVMLDLPRVRHLIEVCEIARAHMKAEEDDPS